MNSSSEAGSAPIDAYAPLREGAYVTDAVTVAQMPAHRSRHTTAQHPVFVPEIDQNRLTVWHRLRLAELDDGLAELLHRELFATGLVSGEQMFQRIFTGVVRSSDPDALTAWTAFYANTLERLLRPEPSAPGHAGLAAYAPVYQRACQLAVGDSALELGCCFGFLSLQLARGGMRVIASDVNPGTLRLLDDVKGRLGTPVTTLRADAAAVGLPDGCVDTVLAIHLLEHLSLGHGAKVVAEAIRLARRRVVIAVPYESEPEPAYGHVRTFDHETLTLLGYSTGLPYRVFDHHGGWLVLDKS